MKRLIVLILSIVFCNSVLALSDDSSEVIDPDFNRPKVKSIGIIVSTNDKKHFDFVMNELLATARAKDILIGTIYQVGSKPGTAPFSILKDRLEFGVRGSKIIFSKDTPEKYQVTSSPSWIVGLQDGEVIFEGFKKPSVFISASGRLRQKLDFSGDSSVPIGDSESDQLFGRTKNMSPQSDEEPEETHLFLERTLE